MYTLALLKGWKKNVERHCISIAHCQSCLSSKPLIVTRIPDSYIHSFFIPFSLWGWDIMTPITTNDPIKLYFILKYLPDNFMTSQKLY